MTYAGLAVPFVAAAVLVLMLAVAVRRPGHGWWLATGSTVAVLLILTAVFDNVMIAAGLFHYDPARLAGPHLGRAPVEDLAWPVAAGIGLPALTLLLGGEEEVA